MRTSIFVLALGASSVCFANTQTHQVYVHKAGIDTSMYQTAKPPSADYSQLNSLADRIRAKREMKASQARDAEYSTDLIDATNGLKNVTPETIKPLIQKYPEKSSELLDLLKN